jgi:hypothetical protein
MAGNIMQVFGAGINLVRAHRRLKPGLPLPREGVLSALAKLRWSFAAKNARRAGEGVPTDGMPPLFTRERVAD